MAPKNMKLLLAALALLLALAATSAHAAPCTAIPDCKTCDEPTVCTECNEDYTLTDAKGSNCTDACTVEHCTTCSTTEFGGCATCDTGYKVAATPADGCAPLCTIANCELCASATTCASCTDGFVFGDETNTTCTESAAPSGGASEDGGHNGTDSSTGAACAVEHCAECAANATDVCERCDDKYKLADDNQACHDGVVAPARAAAAALAACVLAAAVFAL